MPICGGIGMAALTWVASPVVKELFDKSKAFLGSDITKGLEDLETTLIPQFQLTVQAAQNNPHKAELARWLARLKNAYYEAEAILHELEYERLRHKAKSEQNKLGVRISSNPVMKPFAKFTSKVNKKLTPKNNSLLKQLNNLKEIADEAKHFRKLLKITETENIDGTTSDNNPPVTSSLLPDKVFGRDGDRDQIIKFLLEKENKGGSSSSSAIRSYPVFAITGIGGSGKTTLLQYVYNDKRVIKHFGGRMWICLSQRTNLEERTKDMIECVTQKRPDLTNLNELQKMLRDALLSKPKGVLLVLDNFRNHENESAQNEQWTNLLAPFVCIRERSKILITSRSDKFPAPLHPAKLIKLSDLADSDFLLLFRYYSGLSEISNAQMQNDIYCTIGDKIVSKLSKSPLAARAVGEQLYKNRDAQFWQNTERNVNLSDTMKALLWSFQCMDVQVQRCFIFCGVFPKHLMYTGYDLVQYWIALDFIQPSDDGKGVEDIGADYFQMMVASSIFQFVNGRYCMHDLYCDLAEQLSAGDCFRIEKGKRDKIPSTTLHVYLSIEKYESPKEKLSSIYELRNLRTLILNISHIEDLSDIFSTISKRFKHLRTLDVWSERCKILPSVVGDLKNLRYLSIWDTMGLIKELPNSVLQLYHLQFLLLPPSIESLPTKLGDLIKLRSVGKYDMNFNHVSSLPPVPYLGKLTSLQHLDEFHVRREKGYGLEQLGCLCEIGGSLRIVNLENVHNEEEAVAARLVDKFKLTDLELVWAESADNIGSQSEVTKALKPPPSLRSLAIDGYSDSRYPAFCTKARPYQI